MRTLSVTVGKDCDGKMVKGILRGATPHFSIIS